MVLERQERNNSVNVLWSCRRTWTRRHLSVSVRIFRGVTLTELSCVGEHPQASADRVRIFWDIARSLAEVKDHKAIVPKSYEMVGVVHNLLKT